MPGSCCSLYIEMSLSEQIVDSTPRSNREAILDFAAANTQRLFCWIFILFVSTGFVHKLQETNVRSDLQHTGSNFIDPSRNFVILSPGRPLPTQGKGKGKETVLKHRRKQAVVHFCIAFPPPIPFRCRTDSSRCARPNEASLLHCSE